ncbi:MAG: hypothetical protein KKD69_02550 [Euryarchaeota archaeon]|nr:hypothetical protein [Euryarchaeota archaeon]MCG2725812.1 hypothetical protein [Elusimicrobiota bacterium]
MKKTILLMGIILLPAGVISGEVIREPLRDPMENRNLKISRPEADKIVLSVSTKLKFSAKQEERITDALKKETSKFDKTFDDYRIAEEKEKKWRSEMNNLRYEMFRINMGIPNVIRDYLDEEQKEAFDRMIEEKMAPQKALPKERKRIKRKRVKKAVKTETNKPAKQPKADAPKPSLLESVPAEDEDMGYYP